MYKLFVSALDAYTQVFKIHLSNKGKDPTHHQFTADAYDQLFEVMHLIGEKLADTGEPILTQTNEEFRKEAYDVIEGLKKEIDNYIGNDKPTIGADNMLRGIIDKMEGLCNVSNSYIVECEEDEMEDKETKEEPGESTH